MGGCIPEDVRSEDVTVSPPRRSPPFAALGVAGTSGGDDVLLRRRLPGARRWACRATTGGADAAARVGRASAGELPHEPVREPAIMDAAMFSMDAAKCPDKLWGPNVGLRRGQSGLSPARSETRRSERCRAIVQT